MHLIPFPENPSKEKTKEREKKKVKERQKEKKKHKVMNEIKRENGEVKQPIKGGWKHSCIPNDVRELHKSRLSTL